MSTSEISGGAPNRENRNSDPPPEFDHPDGTLAADIPPDPLLKSGTFIDASEILTEARTSEEGIEGDQEEEYHEMTTAAEESLPVQPLASVVDTSNRTDAAPVPENIESPPSEFRRPWRGSAKRGSELAVISAPSEYPLWLPPGWLIDYRVRSSGASAGVKDRYYVDPVSGHRFRSKKEVLHFMETGTLRKKMKLKENPDTDITSLESSGVHKQKRSGSRAKSSTASNFDFDDVPLKINWVLTDSSQGSWTPYISDEKVPESSQREWAAAFASLTVRNGGRTMF